MAAAARRRRRDDLDASAQLDVARELVDSLRFVREEAHAIEVPQVRGQVPVDEAGELTVPMSVRERAPNWRENTEGAAGLDTLGIVERGSDRPAPTRVPSRGVSGEAGGSA